ncbi:MAG TPA: RNA polymerase sigma-54 factor [Bacteroidales bacterium]|nr:RNA polymerase sigma-54 factor [Bacteroidales bacterium]
MSTKASLTQETALKQRTTLTPMQIQEVRVLEYTTLELEQRIDRELEENPGLERGDDAKEESLNEEFDNDNEGEDALQNDEFDLSDYISDDDTPDYMLHSNNSSPDDKQEDIPFSVGESFQEYLSGQLGLLPLSEDKRKVAQYILGNIDENGYLSRSPEALADDLAFHANIDISDKEMMDIIHTIQYNFEPAGVCARNLQECLLLQLQRRQQSPSVVLATKILEKYYKEFATHHYQKIIDRLGITDQQLREAETEIRHLTPKPGNALQQDLYTGHTIIPDFIVEVNGNNITISLNNGNIPELHVNSEFNQILQNYQRQSTHTREEKEAISFIKDRIDSARWFIDAVRQRNETLTRTMTAIVQLQRDYFLEGDENLLKPMILKDVADKTGYDISTISRVSNSKYVQTPYGVLPLKFFFSESMTNESGEEVATRAIKNALLDIIDKEDKQNPLNDDELVEALREKGFTIARRTVAKYRKQLHIPVARLRIVI